ncbi:MAG: PAS domain S-box protein [candidate division KSB1 bacterium]|nr:PAS domain S-box protein [candidate division KSB1 bacterium]
MSNYIEYKNFLDTFPCAVVWLYIDPDTETKNECIVDICNPAFEKTVDQKDCAGKPLSKLLPDIAENIYAFIERLGEGEQDNFIYLNKETQKEYHCNIYSPSPGSIGLVMLERPRFEEPFAKALKAGKIGTWTWDIETGHITWSETVSEMFGFQERQSDVNFRTFLKNVHEKDRFVLLDALKSSVKNKTRYQVEHRIVKPDGAVRWMHEAGDWVRDEHHNVKKMYGIVYDITEPKNYRDAQQLLVELVNRSGDAVIIQSPDGIIKSWNDGAQQIYGYSEPEMLGESIKKIIPESQHQSIDELYLSICGGKKIDGYETIRCRKDGTHIYVSITFSPIFDDRGRISVITSIARDITGWIEKEQELVQAKETLEQRVMERTMEIQERNLDLQKEVFRRKRYQQQLRKLGMHLMHVEEKERRRIATGLHDRIVQILALAKIKTGILRKKFANDESYADIDQIYEILDESIDQTRTLTFELSPPVLYEMGLAAAIEWLAGEFSDRYDLDIIVDARNEIPSLHEDVRNVLFQSVRELCNNIVKHAQAENVKISLEQKKGKIIIIIRDNGVGFNPDQLEQHESGGFGLFNIKDRMAYLDGSVDINSEPDKGTVVTLSVPTSVQ